MMKRSSKYSLALIFCLAGISVAFAPVAWQCQRTSPPSSTTLQNGMLLDVPDNFFFVTMVGAGLVLGFTKNFGRMRMEERAWEQRLEEARQRRLDEDPTLSELDLRRREAELEWSAYGKPRLEQEEVETIRRQMEEREQELRGSRRRVRVMARDEEEEEGDSRTNRMTDKEIDQFEMEFGIDYDPYYDDPYTLEELPEGNYRVDKKYGDIIYDDGEIFYKDSKSGLYYRQGARPRSMNFFSP